MANHFAALKRARQNQKRAAQNRARTTRLRHTIREIRRAISAGDADKAKSLLPRVVSTIDKSLKKGVIKANSAGRFKGRLMTRLAKMGKST
jgi:small subunit ribosomal protein S20